MAPLHKKQRERLAEKQNSTFSSFTFNFRQPRSHYSNIFIKLAAGENLRKKKGIPQIGK